ncbi:MAG: hypothetical protein IJ491_09130 [Clostridia bacterium]|nr:hypothetical protein [Clostridia bacterium]
MRIPENYIRKALLVCLVAVTAVFQHTSGAIPSLFGTRAMLLIPLVVAIAVYERSMNGLFFGALAGILWDFATVRGDGFFSVSLAAAGFLCGSLVTYIMRNNLATNLILSLVSTGTVNVVYWLIFIFRKGYEGSAQVLFGYYLPSVLYTMVFAFVYYYLVGFIHKATIKKKSIRHG